MAAQCVDREISVQLLLSVVMCVRTMEACIEEVQGGVWLCRCGDTPCRRFAGGCNFSERPRSSGDVLWSQHHIFDAANGCRGATAASQARGQGHRGIGVAAPITHCWPPFQDRLIEVPCGSQRQPRVSPSPGGKPEQVTITTLQADRVGSWRRSLYLAQTGNVVHVSMQAQPCRGADRKDEREPPHLERSCSRCPEQGAAAHPHARPGRH